MPPSPKSARWPWARSLAYALVLALSPAVWASQATSCAGRDPGTPVSFRELTGIDLVHDLAGSNEVLAWLLVVLCTALIAGIPVLASRAPTPGRRLGWHVAGLFGALLAALVVLFAVTFTIFYQRVVRVSGHVVLLLTALPVLESVVRIVLGAIELRTARSSHLQAPPPPTAPG